MGNSLGLVWGCETGDVGLRRPFTFYRRHGLIAPAPQIPTSLAESKGRPNRRNMASSSYTNHRLPNDVSHLRPTFHLHVQFCLCPRRKRKTSSTSNFAGGTRAAQRAARLSSALWWMEWSFASLSARRQRRRRGDQCDHQGIFRRNGQQVTMTVSLSGDGLDSYTDNSSFTPNPSALMGNYVCENAGR